MPQFIQFQPSETLMRQSAGQYADLDKIFNNAIQMQIENKRYDDRRQQEQARYLEQRQQMMNDQAAQRASSMLQTGVDLYDPEVRARIPQAMAPQQMAPEQGGLGGMGIGYAPKMVPTQDDPITARLREYIGRQKQAQESKSRGAQLENTKTESEIVKNLRDPNKAPTGFMWNPTQTALVAIPGGPAEIKAKELAQKEREANNSVQQHSENVISAADNAMKSIGFTSTGITGAFAAKIPGSKRKQLQGYIDTLKSNLAFGRLQEMREQSKTGGALGQVSDRELNLLSSVVASLDADQPPEVLTDNIKKIRTKYEEILNKLNSGSESTSGRSSPSGWKVVR